MRRRLAGDDLPRQRSCCGGNVLVTALAGGVSAKRHVGIGDALAVVDRRGRRPGGHARPASAPRLTRGSPPAPPRGHSSQPPARSATTCATAGASTPRLTTRRPPSSRPAARSSGSDPMPYSGTWITANTRVVDDQGCAVAAPVADGVEEHAAEDHLFGHCDERDQRRPDEDHRVDRRDCETRRTPRESSHAATSAPPPATPSATQRRAWPSGTPSGGDAHRKQRDREDETRGHGGSRVRPPTAIRSPIAARSRAGRWRCAGLRQQPVAPCACARGERPRRRRNYLAGPGAARAGAISGRSG